MAQVEAVAVMTEKAATESTDATEAARLRQEQRRRMQQQQKEQQRWLGGGEKMYICTKFLDKARKGRCHESFCIDCIRVRWMQTA